MYVIFSIRNVKFVAFLSPSPYPLPPSPSLIFLLLLPPSLLPSLLILSSHLELNSRGTATDPTGSFHRSSSPSSCGSPGEGGGGEGEGGGGGKATTLVLSEEEKKMLSEEGIFIPTDMPLTKVSSHVVILELEL